MSNHPLIECQPWRDPRELFAEFATRPHCVWLDTASGPGISILAAEPAQVFRSKGRRCEVINADGITRMEANPFDVLKGQLDAHRRRLGVSAAAEPFPLGAAIGYFGYDLKNLVEKLPDRARDDIGLPDCWFGFYDHQLVFDHGPQKLFEVGGARRARPATLSSAGRDEQSDGLPLPGITSNCTRDDYRRAVLRAKEYITAGDVYQVNISQRFQCDVPALPAEVYLALRTANPAPYCAYLDIGEAQILSSSPECFLNIRDRHVVTRPIKGTRPRAAGADRRAVGDEDARIAAELLASPKDNAELVMITDLERNDLGKVCEFGSVTVRELRRVESFATVHHLVATVEGRLRPDVSHVDCVRACFPGGSITGAPKIRAMQIIDELEPHARGVYTGAIGCLGFNGVSHFNIAIRTLVKQGTRLTFHAGGGIVADSEPDAEYDETLAKAQGIFNAIEQLRLRERPLRA